MGRARAALIRREGKHALSLLRLRRHAGEGFAARRRQFLHPSAPRLPGVRRPVHDLRARAAARTRRRQEVGAARALRPRQAHAFAARSRCASARSIPSASSGWSMASCGSSRVSGEAEVESSRIGELVIEGLRSLDHVAYRALRLGLSRFSRGQGLQRAGRRTCRRGEGLRRNRQPRAARATKSRTQGRRATGA